MTREMVTQAASFMMIPAWLALSFAEGAQDAPETPQPVPRDASGAPEREAPTKRQDFPEGLVERYKKISDAMRSKDMRSFMSAFNLDFIFEARDGSCLDRGPWRRFWLDDFEERNYESVSFELDRLLENEEERAVVRTRMVIVFRKPPSGTKLVQEVYFVDTWAKADGDWQMWYRKERELATEGVLPPAESAPISSPRIAALARDLRLGKSPPLAGFWKEIEKRAPLVESIPGDDAHRWVTFIWRGRGRERGVGLEGGLPADVSPKPLYRLEGTDLWYRTERIPADARFTYEFHLTTSVSFATGAREAKTVRVLSTSRDPFNKEEVDGRSVAAMPDAPTSTLTVSVPERPGGAFKQHALQSAVLDERRIVSVYTPLGYEALDAPCKSVFLLDGGDYRSRKVTRAVLDNLIAEKKTGPAVVVLIHSQGSRSSDLTFSPAFAQFVAEELVPWVRKNFRVSQSPRDSIIGGNGVGGALAALCGLKHPRLFGNVFVESGDFGVHPDASRAAGKRTREHGWIARQFAKAPKEPLRFYLQVGCFESARAVSANQRLRDVLEAKGYPCTYAEFHGNHNSLTWHLALAKGLTALLGG